MFDRSWKSGNSDDDDSDVTGDADESAGGAVADSHRRPEVGQGRRRDDRRIGFHRNSGSEPNSP